MNSFLSVFGAMAVLSKHISRLGIDLAGPRFRFVRCQWSTDENRALPGLILFETWAVPYKDDESML